MLDGADGTWLLRKSLGPGVCNADNSCGLSRQLPVKGVQTEERKSLLMFSPSFSADWAYYDTNVNASWRQNYWQFSAVAEACTGCLTSLLGGTFCK